MDRDQAVQDLQFIRRALDMTRRRVDPQMFHAIIWGCLVSVWFPLMNWLELLARHKGQLWISIAAIGFGTLLSTVLGYRAGRHPRLKAANTRLAAQLGASVAVFVVSGLLLSFVIPALIHGGERYIPHVWGFIYAFMLLEIGIFYSREFFYCGVLVFLGAVAALAWVTYAGFILGAVIGLGCIVPGVIAEQRVARLRRETMDLGSTEGGNEEL